MRTSSHDIAAVFNARPAVYYRVVKVGRLYLFWATKKRVDCDERSVRFAVPTELLEVRFTAEGAVVEADS